MISGKCASRMPSSRPSRIFQSTGLTPAAFTRTRTESGPTLGSGSSVHSTTSGPPYCLIAIAFMPGSQPDDPGNTP